MSDNKVGNLAFRQPQPLPDQGSIGGQSGQIGNWRGETLRVAEPDLARLLSEAKEELTFAHSERMEQKSMRERKVTAPNEAMIERIAQIREIQEWVDKLPDLDTAQLQEFLDEARRGGQDSESLLGRARERFGDPSHAFAALDIVEQMLRGENPEVANAAAAARDALLEAEGPSVRAGINITSVAFELAQHDREAAGELRSLYREVVLGNPTPAGIYRAILQRYGSEDFSDRLRFLSRAIGDDLAAAGPSIPPAQLREVLDGLSSLRVLDTAHDRCGLLSQRIGRLSGVTPPVTDVMRALLPLTEQTTYGPGTVSSIPSQLGIPESRLDARILLMGEARAVMALLPTGIYRDQDSRFAVLRSLQEAMDTLIEREEMQ
jgi:type III secretion protein W